MTLVNPAKTDRTDQLGKAWTIIFGDAHDPARVIQKGFIEIGHWNPELEGYQVQHTYLEDWKYFYNLGVYDYGVADNPQQVIDRYGAILDLQPENYCFFFVHIPKNPAERMGWRWHKWGPYIGDGEPTCEYLADEKLFDDGVYTFTLYRVLEVEESQHADGA